MPATRSPAQIEASRRNGARSKGPVTPEGKERASRNALKHGLTATYHLVLEDEGPAPLEALPPPVPSGPRRRGARPPGSPDPHRPRGARCQQRDRGPPRPRLVEGRAGRAD